MRSVLVSLALLGLACQPAGVPPPVVTTQVPAAALEPRAGPPVPAPVGVELGLDLGSLVFVPSVGNGLLQLDHPGPSLALVIDLDLDDPNRADVAERLAAGDGFTRLSDRDAGRLGLTRPTTVWMFGPEGPCAATLGSAYAIGDAEGSPVLELGFELEPCAERFAPLAHVDASPPALRWQPAGCEDPVELDARDGDGPRAWPRFAELGAFAWALGADHPSAPAQVWLRRCAAGPVVESSWSWIWPDADCWDAEQRGRALTLDGSGGGEVGWSALPDPGVELIGALLADDGPALVLAHAPPELLIGAWAGGELTWTPTVLGSFHDEVVAYADSTWSVLDCDDEP